MQDLFPAFRGQREEGQSVLLAPTLSQETLIQNNQPATFGVTCSEPQHYGCSHSNFNTVIAKNSAVYKYIIVPTN